MWVLNNHILAPILGLSTLKIFRYSDPLNLNFSIVQLSSQKIRKEIESFEKVEAYLIYRDREAIGLEFQPFKRGQGCGICWHGSYNALKHEISRIKVLDLHFDDSLSATLGIRVLAGSLTHDITFLLFLLFGACFVTFQQL